MPTCGVSTMNDETLTLYYYDELGAAERREVEAALAADKIGRAHV